eukprot:GILK01008315.1.p1 GENE.GILK01008315.1~~GILK01008315.1.p1  ORF type:complete len:980 (+),score=193.72 GILK01008315.1:42-2981(+)
MSIGSVDLSMRGKTMEAEKELIKVCERLLRPAEKVITVVSARRSYQGRKKPIYVAFIFHETQISEYALFVLSPGMFGKLSIQTVLPVTRELKVNKNEEAILEVQWISDPESYFIEFSMPGDRHKITDKLLEALKSAEQENWAFPSGGNHRWLWQYEAYIPKAVRSRNTVGSSRPMSTNERDIALPLPDDSLNGPATAVNTAVYNNSNSNSNSNSTTSPSGSSPSLADRQSVALSQAPPSTIGKRPPSTSLVSEIRYPAADDDDEPFNSVSDVSGSPSASPNDLSKDKLEKLPNIDPSDVPAVSWEQYNPDDLSFIREDWIRKQMKRRRHEFTTVENMRVFIGTWNVNGKKPGEDLLSWLEVQPAPDIYIIGLQEICELNAQNLLVDSDRSRLWELHIEKNLKQLGSYVQLMSRHLVGLMLCIYVRVECLPHIPTSELQGTVAGVGVMGVGGNKGGVAIRFRMFDSSLCFVNSHLAAHQDNASGRNQDFRNLVAKLVFKDSNNIAFNIYEHDHIFWFGDLNYRFNLDDAESIFRHIEREEWETLREFDQLNIARSHGDAFNDFQEGLIHFAPTYKYKTQSQEYERKNGELKRNPAWCDRILWRGEPITQLFYGRSELVTSDHKPVSSIFNVQMQTVVVDKQRQVHQSIVRSLDAWENEYIPKVVLSALALDFAQVRYDIPVKQQLTLENVGQVLVQYRFVAKLEEAQVFKPWMVATPAYGVVLPGEKVDITVMIHVDDRTARMLFAGEEHLEDILIIRLEHGRDYFLTVTANYLQSCFGATLEQLVWCTQPVRSMDIKAVNADMKRLAGEDGATPPLPIPKELWRMIDYLYTFGLQEKGLFAETGIEDQMQSIRECIDSGAEFEAFSIHSMSETLLQFLCSLAEPVVPTAMLLNYLERPTGTGGSALCQQFLAELTPVHHNVFLYIASFLRELLQHREKNKLTPERLSLVFSSCLMRLPPSNEPMLSRLSLQTFFMHFLA